MLMVVVEHVLHFQGFVRMFAVQRLVEADLLAHLVTLTGVNTLMMRSMA